eukprot:SAG31_NODE_21730_length_542_cov_0.925508_1_plen_32_part_10
MTSENLAKCCLRMNRLETIWHVCMLQDHFNYI